MKTKKTMFIDGIGKEENRESLINAFSTFGDIIDIHISTTSANNWENPMVHLLQDLMVLID